MVLHHLAPTDLPSARTWSQSLSGCPSFTDSEVKRKVSCVMVDLPVEDAHTHRCTAAKPRLKPI